MKRRKFLQLSGLAAAAVAVPGIAYLASPLNKSAAAIIINEFHYLKLDKEGVDKFVVEFLKVYPPSGSFTTKVRTARIFKMKASQAHLGSNITQQYLLSTDFFRNKMDESKLVKYIGYFDGFLMPCSNPFAETFYPPKPNA